MEDPVEPDSSITEETRPGWLAVHRKWLLIGGGIFVLLLVNATGLFLIYEQRQAVPTPPAAAAQSAPPPTQTVLNEADLTAVHQRILVGDPAQAKPPPEPLDPEALRTMHLRILDEDSRGSIASLSLVKPRLLSAPAAVPEGPIPGVAGEPAADAKSPSVQAQTPEVATESAVPAPPAGLTPMGRLGYGVSKDNLDSLKTMVEEMNQMTVKKDKKR